MKDKKLLQLFLDEIEKIAINPYEAGISKTGDLVGIYGVDVKYKGQNYEIAYSIRENEKGDLIIIILKFRTLINQ